MSNSTSRLACIAAATGLLALGTATSASAQVSAGIGPSTGVAQPHVSNGTGGYNEQTLGHTRHAPVGSVFGIPIYVSSPVNAPYNAAAAYSTYAGQPGGGEDAILSQSVASTSR